MDATEDDVDIRLHRNAADWLGEFDASIQGFLYLPAGKASGHPAKQPLAVRRHVRARAAIHLINLLDPFQGFPQLLDVHLAAWLPLLADAFLASVDARSTKADLPAAASSSASLVVMLQTAVARLLYTFCKVRGEKVIVHFLPVETRHLERLLGALERSEAGSSSGSLAAAPSSAWTWEERYVVLLWLAQLLLAPFDLSTISTGRALGDEEGDELPQIAGFVWPGSEGGSPSAAATTTLPSITVRVLPLALKYLAAAGKERDAARALLVRVAMRRDMQALGVRRALVQWALFTLQRSSPSPSPSGPETPVVVVREPYYYIGSLSFLAGLLSAAAGTSDMDDSLAPIFAAILAVADADETDYAGRNRADPVFAAIRSSALARKMMIKAVRAIAVRYIQTTKTHDASDADAADAAIETTIGYLLGCLADNDTPVRFAASKALSIITLRLDPDMAAQVIDAVLEALQRNVFTAPGQAAAVPDLTAVDPLEWHGLMLTLAHLLYRRSPPLSALPAIVVALRRGLAFERRSVSGSATGTNVRDAACFGLWALARRYTTDELQSLAGSLSSLQRAAAADVPAASAAAPEVSLLQVMATDLVVAASLDPAGNIRRGSSAALQELIGRHPDTVCQGIALVQAVDYHAVALRARALASVARQATRLSRVHYGVPLRDALLGWRGLADAADANARRAAATSFGQIAEDLMEAGPRPQAAQKAETTTAAAQPKDTAANTHAHALAQFKQTVQQLVGLITSLQPRQVEERHGLLLALAAVLDTFPILVAAHTSHAASSAQLSETCLDTIQKLGAVLAGCQALGSARRPDLLAEAASRMIVSSFPVIQAAVLGIDAAASSAAGQPPLLPGPSLIVEANAVPARTFRSIVAAMDTARASAARDPAMSSAIKQFANVASECLCTASSPAASSSSSSSASLPWLARQEADVMAASSDAALVLLVATPLLRDRNTLIRDWASTVRSPGKKRVAPSSTKRTYYSGKLGGAAGGGSSANSGYVFALTKAYPLVAATSKDPSPSSSLPPLDGDSTAAAPSVSTIAQAILDRWAADRSIDTRVALLQALGQSPAVLAITAEGEGAEQKEGEQTPKTTQKEPSTDTSRFLSVLAAGLDDYTTDARGDVGSHVRLQALRATQVLWGAQKKRGQVAGSVQLFIRVLRLAAEKLDRVRVAAQATLAAALDDAAGSHLQTLTFSSRAYFRLLLGLWDSVNGKNGVSSSPSSPPSIAAAAKSGGTPAGALRWMTFLLRGYVTSADTGNEELVIASRAALVDYAQHETQDNSAKRQERTALLWQALVRNLPGGTSSSAATGSKPITPPDRVVVPTLEVFAYLFYAGVFPAAALTAAAAASLCQQVHQAAEKTGSSMRKLEACIKVYGAVASAEAARAFQADDDAGGGDGPDATPPDTPDASGARARLGALLGHPWPRVRTAVVDELWGLGLAQGLGLQAQASTHEAAAEAVTSASSFAALKGVDWGTAEAEAVAALGRQLGLVRA